MGQSTPIFKDQAFDPEALDVLARSYAKTMDILHSTGELKAPSEDVSELIAQRLIELGRRGERDEARLTIEVLKFLRAKPILRPDGV